MRSCAGAPSRAEEPLKLLPIPGLTHLVAFSSTLNVHELHSPLLPTGNRKQLPVVSSARSDGSHFRSHLPLCGRGGGGGGGGGRGAEAIIATATAKSVKVWSCSILASSRLLRLLRQPAFYTAAAFKVGRTDGPRPLKVAPPPCLLCQHSQGPADL